MGNGIIESRQPENFVLCNDGRGDQDIFDPRSGKGFRFRKLCCTNSGAVSRFKLPFGDFGTLVRFGMGTQLFAAGCCKITHFRQILFEQIQIEDQCRCIKFTL
jgi:hypothetical protein